MKKICLALILLFSINTQAQVPEVISKNFTFIRSGAGELIRVDINQNKDFYSDQYYIKHLNNLIDNIENRSFSEKEDFFKDWPEEYLKIKEMAISISIEQQDFAPLYTKDVKNIFADLIAKLKNAEVNRVVASPNSSRYFFKNKIEDKIKSEAISALKAIMDVSPALNVAFFLVNDFAKQYQVRRNYYQNMLLFYLRTLNLQTLGLNNKEVKLIKSSIWESKISILDKKESDKAVNNWLEYGSIKEEKAIRKSDKKLKALDTKGKDIDRYNIAFAEIVNDNASSKIWNLMVEKSFFSSKASLAISLDKKDKIKKRRLFLKSLQVLAKLTSVPEPIDSALDIFIESYYLDQIKYEGALLGHLLIHSDYELIEVLIGQSLNYELEKDFLD